MATENSAEQSVALRQIASDAPKYTGYRALDASQREIRVLDLGANLTCTLRHVSLISNPVYYALSYYWGPPGSTKPLTIKAAGSGETKIVQIRKTLAKFLKSLYQQYREITVWLDVICINQRSVVEQSAQVAMMGDIYRQANGVYAWMGPWDPDIEYCFRYTAATSPERNASGYDLKKVAACVETLFLRPYWTRVWIIQECVLNQMLILVCGRLSVGWGALHTAVPGLFSFEGEDLEEEYSLPGHPQRPGLSPALQRYAMMQQLRPTGPFVPTSSILGLAVMLQASECSDPRDAIYGFRALARDGDDLCVDYSRGAFDLLIRAVSLYNKNRIRKGHLSHAAADSRLVAQNRSEGGFGAMEQGTVSDYNTLVLNVASFSKMMTPVSSDVLAGLRDEASDCLIMHLHKSAHPRHCHTIDHPDYGVYNSPEEVRPQYYVAGGWWVMDFDLDFFGPGMLILDDGRIVNLAWDWGIMSETRHLFWFGQVWVCRVSEAVHFSRFLYALCLALEDGKDSERVLSLKRYAETAQPPTTPHRCNCDKTVDARRPSPWAETNGGESEEAQPLDPEENVDFSRSRWGPELRRLQRLVSRAQRSS